MNEGAEAEKEKEDIWRLSSARTNLDIILSGSIADFCVNYPFLNPLDSREGLEGVTDTYRHFVAFRGQWISM